MEENGIPVPDEIHSALETLRLQGKASILTARERVCIGIIALSDVLRLEAADMSSA